MKRFATLATLALVMSTGAAIAGPYSGGSECSESYRICNGGCDRHANGNSGGSCRIQCDYRLIACDQPSAAASLTQSGRYSVPRPTDR